MDADVPDDTAAGSRTDPFKSISAGIARATAVGKSMVYVKIGSYFETLSFTADQRITVEGGWNRAGPDWTRNCAPPIRAATFVQAPTPTVVLVEGLTQLVELKTMYLATPEACSTPDDADGESRIAVIVRDGLLGLQDVDVFAGPGCPGGTATQGAAGRVTSCDRVNDCADTNVVGTRGGSGASASAGTFDATGFIPAEAGAGGQGGAGTNGAAGAAGEQGDCQGACACSCSAGCNTADSCFYYDLGRRAGHGMCGCGGEGGVGGNPGRSGGASVALLVSGGTSFVDLHDSSLTASAGGDGSDGGSGGPGGSGQDSAAGADVACPRKDSCSCVSSPVCGPAQTDTLAGGAAGGQGAAGGPGGAGGGGAGGPSHAIVEVGEPPVEADLASLEVAAGGNGAGSAPNGASSAKLLVP